MFIYKKIQQNKLKVAGTLPYWQIDQCCCQECSKIRSRRWTPQVIHSTKNEKWAISRWSPAKKAIFDSPGNLEFLLLVRWKIHSFRVGTPGSSRPDFSLCRQLKLVSLMLHHVTFLPHNFTYPIEETKKETTQMLRSVKSATPEKNAFNVLGLIYFE